MFGVINPSDTRLYPNRKIEAVKRSIIVIFSIVVGWVFGTFSAVALKLVGVDIPASMAKTYSQYNTYSGAVVLVLIVFFSWAMYQVLARRFLEKKAPEPALTVSSPVATAVEAWAQLTGSPRPARGPLPRARPSVGSMASPPEPLSAGPVLASSATEPTASSQKDAFKVCPQCAEEVKAAALICRYCRYKFRPLATTGCRSCGYTRTPPGKTSCYNCGRPLGPDPSAALPVATTGRPGGNPSPTASPMVKPSPTIDMGLLGQNYLAIATKYNDYLDQLWADYGQQSTRAQDHALYGGEADAAKTFMDRIDQLVFPESMQADVEALLNTTEAERVLALQLLTEGTNAEARSLFKKWDAARTAKTNAASKVRSDLALPSTKPPLELAGTGRSA
jgi:hypothetical protein